ncbi:MAG TPA: FCD domain-containing protein [Conexibacter sp.]|nr:FCD domain-containing protein [Conexibacter sp.]
MAPTHSSQPGSFAQVRSGRLADLVAEAMLERVVGEQLEPGHRLPAERELCEQFDVSRTVVREAIRSLAARGIVESRPGSGLVVAAVPSAVVRDALGLYLSRRPTDPQATREVRRLLEVQSARLAAERADAEALALLEQAHEAMAELARVAPEETEQLGHADLAFHRALAAATGNHLFVVLLDAISTPLLELRVAHLGVPRLRERALRSHGELVARVGAHDASGAARVMREHLADVNS